jgi:putative transposase
MGIDLGVNNLATIVDNTGLKPLLIKGTRLKSINQYYNKYPSYA